MSQCRHSAGKIHLLVEKPDERVARLHILGKILVAFKDPTFTQLLSNLEHAKSSMMLAFQMYSMYREPTEMSPHDFY